MKTLCFLDVLGFKNLFNAIGLEAIHGRYEKLIEFVMKESRCGIDIAKTPEGHVAIGWLNIEGTYFSDTILFWTDYSKISLPTFTRLISKTVCFGIEIELPLRGTIVIGEMILDREKGVYLGKPIIEAAQTEEIQKWIGVSFGKSFSEPPYNQGFHLDTILPYKSHYKNIDSEYVTGMTVDWVRIWRETKSDNLRELIKSLNTDEKYADYYVNTLKFIDFSEENNDWFKKREKLNYG